METPVLLVLVETCFAVCHAITEQDTLHFGNSGASEPYLGAIRHVTVTDEGNCWKFGIDGVPDHHTFGGENSYVLPKTPSIAAKPSLLPDGPIAIGVNGVLMYNPPRVVDNKNELKESADNEIQEETPSSLLGVAFDGFPIYGPNDENGNRLTSADLDECHGRTNSDGVYQYHAIPDHLSILGCFKGTPVSNSGRNCFNFDADNGDNEISNDENTDGEDRLDELDPLDGEDRFDDAGPDDPTDMSSNDRPSEGSPSGGADGPSRVHDRSNVDLSDGEDHSEEDGPDDPTDGPSNGRYNEGRHGGRPGGGHRGPSGPSPGRSIGLSGDGSGEIPRGLSRDRSIGRRGPSGGPAEGGDGGSPEDGPDEKDRSNQKDLPDEADHDDRTGGGHLSRGRSRDGPIVRGDPPGVVPNGETVDRPNGKNGGRLQRNRDQQRPGGRTNQRKGGLPSRRGKRGLVVS